MDSLSPFWTLLILLAIFMVCREIVCWYWKLNDVVTLLKDIKKSLNNIESEFINKPPDRYELKKEVQPILKKCKCGALNPEGEAFCPGCGVLLKR